MTGVQTCALPISVAVAGCDVAQLHGDETLTPYRATGRRLVRAVSLASDADVDAVLALPSDVTVLVDAEDKTRRGGTGLKANWPLAARVARERPIILAGGLRAENVGDAIACVKPWAIDVSSGVEEAPGIKSPTLLAAFFEAYAAALSEFRILNSAFRNGRT